MSSKVTINLLATGVPGLDQILGGGLPEFSFNLLAGPPGCGKTTFAQQLMFSLASEERKALYFTVLGEPPLKMLRYQQQFDFFDEEAIGRSIRFINLSEDLINGDLDRVLSRIVTEVQATNPGLVFVDSFRSMTITPGSADKPRVDVQLFVLQLGMLMTSWQATTFLIGEYFVENDPNPVFTVADGLIWLRQSVQRNSMIRKMEVMKMRGQATLPGLHPFRISLAGITVSAPVSAPAPDGADAADAEVVDGANSAARLSMGVPRLDEMMGGGLPRGYSLLVAGPSGCGKSILAAAFLAEGARRGETGVIASFEQQPGSTRNPVVARLIESGQVGLVDTRAPDLSIDEIVALLLNEARRLGSRRIVIDSLSSFELGLAPTFRDDFRESLSRLVNALTGAGLTVLMTSELEDRYSDLRFSPYGTAFLTDAIVVMRYIEVDSRLRRVMAVVKVRGSAHSDELCEFSIADDGLHIGGMLPEQEGLLGGRPTRKPTHEAPAAEGAGGGDAAPVTGTGAVMTADIPDEIATADARRRLAGLRQEADEAQALLTQLLGEVERARADWDTLDAARLLEANEQLVVSALRAAQDADTAAAALDQAVHSAELDALTRLPNRAVMQDRLQHAISDARRRGTRLALLFVDLDHFKPINDSLGHAMGDEVLVQVAACLQSVVRESDTVSRHGGDEFLILLADLSHASDAARIAAKLIAALGELSCADGRVHGLSASVGISVYPDDADRGDTLIALADAAMYQAKRGGDGGYVLHGERRPADGTPPSPPSPPFAAQGPAQRLPALHEQTTAAAEHEQLRDQLQQANEQLVLSAVNGQELLEAARHKLQRQAESLALVTHELVSPLAAIRNATAVAARLRGTEKRLPEMHRVIERQVAQMSRLLGDLLDVSRAETGKLRLEFERVELDRLVDEAVDTGLPVIEGRHQHLDVRVVEGLLPMRGDPIRLSQVLRNLLDNASKYTPEGGTIGLVLERQGNDAVVTVSDSGIGISAEALPRVFEPFVQDTPATSFDGKGLGLGLTVVRELVHAHGGHVAAHSAGPGRGSRFVVTLPLNVPGEGDLLAD